MNEKLFPILEHSDRAYLFYSLDTKKIFYANELAKTLYGNSKENVKVNEIFPEAEISRFDEAEFMEIFKSKKQASFFDVLTKPKSGETKLCDLKVGALNEECTEVFAEFTFKEGDRLELAKEYVDSSHKAEFILHYDENLTVYYANSHFYDIFTSTKKEFRTTYNNTLANTFTYQKQKEILTHIQEGLKDSDAFHMDVEILTPTGETKWYYLDLQRKSLVQTRDMLLCFLVCVDNRMEVQKQLENVTAYFDIMQELSANLLFHIDLKTKTLCRNETMAKLYALPPVVENFPVPVPESGVVHPDDLENYMEYAHRLMRGIEGSHVARLRAPNGSYEHFHLTCKLMRDADGEPSEMVGKSSNIEKHLEMEQRAFYDNLTKTLNKLTFQEKSTLLLQRSNKESSHALLFIRFKDFDQINEKLGHDFGDFVLESAGKRLQNMVRDQDLVGRVGGDEFTLFLDSFEDVEVLLQRAQKLLETLEVEYVQGEKTGKVEAHIGVAMYPNHGENYEDLYKNAVKSLMKIAENPDKKIVFAST